MRRAVYLLCLLASANILLEFVRVTHCFNVANSVVSLSSHPDECVLSIGNLSAVYGFPLGVSVSRDEPYRLTWPRVSVYDKLVQIRIPSWTSAAIAVPFVLLHLWKVRYRSAHVNDGICKHCKYCTDGVHTPICPECGLRMDLHA